MELSSAVDGPASFARSVTLLCLLGVLLAGCGTTVSVSGAAGEGVAAATSGNAESGSLAAPTAGTDLGVGSPATSGGPGLTTVAPGSVAAPGRPGSGSGTGSGAVQTGAVPPPGSTKPLVIGFIVPADAAGAYTALGANIASQSQSQVEAEDRILLKYVNAHGGIGGRRVVPDFVALNAEDTNWPSDMQAECAHFAEDVHAFAVIEQADAFEPLPQCLARHRTIFIDDGNSYYYDPQQVASFNGYVYRTEFLDLAQIGITVDALVQRGYLKPSDKIGIQLWNTPQDLWAEKTIIKPEMARYHLNVVTDFAYTRPNGFGGLSNVSAEASSAALRFRAAGVDHVFYLDSNAAIPFFFMPESQSQNYYPTSHFSTFDTVSSLVGTAPNSEFAGATVVGVNAHMDIDWAGDRSTATPTGKLCAHIMATGGISNANTLGYLCDNVFFLQALVGHAGSLDGPTIRAAMATLGTRFTSAETFPLSYRPGHDNGIAHARIATFGSGCGCFAYTGPLLAVG